MGMDRSYNRSRIHGKRMNIAVGVGHACDHDGRQLPNAIILDDEGNNTRKQPCGKQERTDK
jgi:hypothetical protein